MWNLLRLGHLHKVPGQQDFGPMSSPVDDDNNLFVFTSHFSANKWDCLRTSSDTVYISMSFEGIGSSTGHSLRL